MKNPMVMILLCLVCGPVNATQNPALTQQQLTEILSHSDRFKQDQTRDKDRLPAKIMDFSWVAAGHKVLDIFAGGGWYSELFSKAVGRKGTVYAQNDELTWRYGQREMTERTQQDRLPNLIRLDPVAIADMVIPAKSIDIAFMAINYHDLFFTHRDRDGETEIMRKQVVDYKSAFTAVKKALKAEGVLIIIDHVAKPGSGYQAANDLHRIDPHIVKYQMHEVGFVLQEEAFYLRYPSDDLSTLVFDPIMRGKTDRFIFKFGKKQFE